MVNNFSDFSSSPLGGLSTESMDYTLPCYIFGYAKPCTIRTTLSAPPSAAANSGSTNVAQVGPTGVRRICAPHAIAAATSDRCFHPCGPHARRVSFLATRDRSIGLRNIRNCRCASIRIDLSGPAVDRASLDMRIYAVGDANTPIVDATGCDLAWGCGRPRHRS